MFYLSGQIIHEQFHPQIQKLEMQDLFKTDSGIENEDFILPATRSTRKPKTTSYQMFFAAP